MHGTSSDPGKTEEIDRDHEYEECHFQGKTKDMLNRQKPDPFLSTLI